MEAISSKLTRTIKKPDENQSVFIVDFKYVFTSALNTFSLTFSSFCIFVANNVVSRNVQKWLSVLLVIRLIIKTHSKEIYKELFIIWVTISRNIFFPLNSVLTRRLFSFLLSLKRSEWFLLLLPLSQKCGNNSLLPKYKFSEHAYQSRRQMLLVLRVHLRQCFS